MFERYTPNARRVVFYALREANDFGSSSINPEHLFLGLLREDKSLTHQALGSHADVEAMRDEVEKHLPVREKVAQTVDLPLAPECWQVFKYAAAEAKGLNHQYIDTGHLLLGLLREESCFVSKVLQERGLRLADLREQMRPNPRDPDTDF